MGGLFGFLLKTAARVNPVLNAASTALDVVDFLTGDGQLEEFRRAQLGQDDDVAPADLAEKTDRLVTMVEAIVAKHGYKSMAEFQTQIDKLAQSMRAIKAQAAAQQALL